MKHQSTLDFYKIIMNLWHEKFQSNITQFYKEKAIWWKNRVKTLFPYLASWIREEKKSWTTFPSNHFFQFFIFFWRVTIFSFDFAAITYSNSCPMYMYHTTIKSAVRNLIHGHGDRSLDLVHELLHNIKQPKEHWFCWCKMQ